jgi:peroxiredoxin
MSRKQTLAKKPPRSRGRTIFLGFLGTVATLYLAILTYHFAVPPTAKANKNVLEQCRILCMQFGLIPTGHIANDARAYLEVFKPWDLSADLTEVLSDSEFEPQPTQTHPLLGRTAPNFELRDDRDQPHSLNEFLATGPTVIVFYYGYSCSHCVAQLFAINDDIKHFRELGANVVALSSDSTQETAEKFAKYGRFDFPTLSDPNNSVAQKYGTFTPAQNGNDEDLQHGTFLVSQAGKVLWAYTGPSPFTDNKTLLFLIAKEHGRMPTKSTPAQSTIPAKQVVEQPADRS